MNEGEFFQDLAVVMTIAGLAAVIFSRLKWPKVFGYILVGILMNGHTWGGSFLADTQSVRVISQLGIVFLMLTMGLEFSTSDMKRLKGIALPTAVLDTAVMVWLGYVIGTRVLGWKLVPSLFLGAAICDSATTLLAKMIGDFGWSRRPFVKNVLGTSVCEDIICVGVIALITGIANGAGMSIAAVGMSMGGLALFFVGTLVFGLVLVPRLLKSVAGRKDNEALLLTLLGLCFFVSWAAYKLEYSLALGAFLVGILGASSEVRDRLHEAITPLRSMFSAMFFVSIGLLVNPSACWANVGVILLLTLVVILGKGVNCFLGGILTGQSVKTSVQMGLSLAQIGEFAFMVALLYVQLSNDLASPLFQVAIGVSLLTTLLNPFLIRWSDPLGEWAQSRSPRRIRRWLDTYGAFLKKYQTAEAANSSRRRVRRGLIELVVIGVLNLAVATMLGLMTRIDWSRFSVVFEKYEAYIFLLVGNIFMVLMFAPIVRITRGLVDSVCDIVAGEGRAGWQSLARNFVGIFVFVAVVAVFGAEILMINTAAMPNNREFDWGMAVIVLVVAVVGWRFFRRMFTQARARFDEALKTDERLANLGEMLTIQVPENVLRRMTLSPESPAVGETVVTLDIRAKTGASVVAVERSGRETRNVGPKWMFRAGDTLVVLGDPDQINALREFLGCAD